MKKIVLFVALSGLILGALIYSNGKAAANNIEAATAINASKLQDGDLIFQSSLSNQSKAIELATRSKYSHCGIIYSENGQFLVFEAVQPVKTTPLHKWIARGKNSHYVVKRLKNADQILTPQVLQKMKAEGQKFSGRDYDLTFEWSDDKIYCSELIWKIYHRATGLQLGQLQPLRDFDLQHPAVQQKMKERYGDNIPLDQLAISPQAVFQSPLLQEVERNKE